MNESLCTALLWYLQTVFLAWKKIIPTLYKHKNIKSQLFKEDNRSNFGFQLSCAHTYTDVCRDMQAKRQPCCRLEPVSGWWWWGGISRQAHTGGGSGGGAGPACLALHRTGTFPDKWDFSLLPYYPFLLAPSFPAKLSKQFILPFFLELLSIKWQFPGKVAGCCAGDPYSWSCQAELHCLWQ